jgi:hypothetical protein
MNHCSRHGIDYNSTDCPRCLADERHRGLLEQVERNHEQSLEFAVEVVRANAEIAKRAVYLRANPGQFKCPHCKYITLLRDADLCPNCHGHIDQEHWQRVASQERAVAAAESARRAQEAAAAREKAESEARRSQEWSGIQDHRITLNDDGPRRSYASQDDRTAHWEAVIARERADSRREAAQSSAESRTRKAQTVALTARQPQMQAPEARRLKAFSYVILALIAFVFAVFLVFL